MMQNEGQSDQLKNWSAISDEGINVKAASSASETCLSASLYGTAGAAGVAYRALQEVRQSWLQVCRGTWPRAEVLFIREPCGAATGNGLCAERISGAGGTKVGESAEVSRGAGRTVRDQQGTAQATRKSIVVSDECKRAGYCVQYRPWASGDAGSEYAGAVWQPRRIETRGGQR